MHEWGPREEDLHQRYEDTGEEPLALVNKPEIPFHLFEYSKAFWLLNTRRQIGMTLNPISLVDILAYIQIFGTPEDDVERFLSLVIKQDAEYLKLKSTKPGEPSGRT